VSLNPNALAAIRKEMRAEKFYYSKVLQLLPGGAGWVDLYNGRKMAVVIVILVLYYPMAMHQLSATTKSTIQCLQFNSKLSVINKEFI